MLLAGGPLQGDLGELVLGDADPAAGLLHAQAEVRHLGNREALVVRDHDDTRVREDLAEFLDHGFLLGSIHSVAPSLALGVAPPRRLSFAGSPGVSGPFPGPAKTARRSASD